MVKKLIASQAAVGDHKLLVSSISKKSRDERNHLHSLIKVLKPKVYILTDSSTFKNLVQELTGNGNIGCTSVSDTSTSLLSPCAATFKPTDHERVPGIQNNMMYTSEDYGFQEISPELSFHSSDHHIGPVSIPVVSDVPPCAIVSKPIDHEQVSVIGNIMMYTNEDFFFFDENKADTNEDFDFQESSPEISFDSSDHHNDLISIPVTSDFSEEIIDYMPSSLISKDDEFQSTWDMMSFPLQYEEMESWFLEMDSSVYNNYGSHWLQPVMPAEICASDCDLSAIM